MLTSHAVKYFGSKAATARALGIGKAAVGKWGERVPPLRAAQIAALTRNKLKFDPSEYQDWYSKNRQASDLHAAAV